MRAGGSWMLALAMCAGCSHVSTPSPPAMVIGHPVRLDPSGKILSWSRDPSPYAAVVRLAWHALERFPPVETGLPAYFSYSRFDPETLDGVAWPHNPAGLNAMLIDSALQYYAFSGEGEPLAIARKLADFQIAHGTSPAKAEWASVPFSSAPHGSTEWGGADDEWCDYCGRGDGIGVLEPDKIGELGREYLSLFEQTGDARYRDAALACAAALIKHVREGDATHSPWPFRVFAADGKVREQYSANVIGAISLFDELLRLSLGDADANRRTRDMAWKWMMDHPMQNDAWSGYFEDIPIQQNPEDNPNQYTALETAKYLLLHPELDPDWREDTDHILHWVVDTFGGDANNERGTQFGATVISEQRADMAKMGSHTARYAAVAAMYFDRTGDREAKETAFRSFNWATYACNDKGIVVVGEDPKEGYWFSDGYGDYIRQFLAGMAAVPEWAPPGEDHLLRATSVVTSISYGTRDVRYATFDAAGREVLRLRARPVAVTSGGSPLAERRDLASDGFAVAPVAGGGFVVRVRHSAKDVVITTGR